MVCFVNALNTISFCIHHLTFVIIRSHSDFIVITLLNRNLFNLLWKWLLFNSWLLPNWSSHLIWQAKWFQHWMSNNCSQATTFTQQHIFLTGNRNLQDFSKMRLAVMEWVSALQYRICIDRQTPMHDHNHNIHLSLLTIIFRFQFDPNLFPLKFWWLWFYSCDAGLLLASRFTI